MIRSQTALIIFIRNPEIGKVKSRIAAACGEEKALEIYRHLLYITRCRTQEFDGPRYLFYSDFIDNTDDWPENLYIKKLQEGMDLGERMKNAFQTVLEKHRSALIIGADCPWLETSLFLQAMELLDTHDAVIGPATDGGYYLLGLNTLIPSLFSNIDWGTDRVFNQTKMHLQHAACSFTTLKMLQDVDFITDWERYLQQTEPA